MAGSTVVVSVLADSKRFTKGFDDMGKSTSKFERGMKGVGKAVGGALAVGTLALGAAALKATKLASNLEQSMGGVDSVFKQFSGQIDGFAKKAGNAVGLTQNSYNELATIIGTTLKNSGTSMDQLGAKTNDLVTRSADLAATFGGPVADASRAMSSALRGEFEPLRRYGVSLNVADINARALRDTNKSSVAELTKQDKALATQALIFEQSKDAAGAFARESNTLAGTLERLKANSENIATTVGGALLPAFTAAAQLANKFVSAIGESAGFQAFVTGLGELVTGLLSGGAGASVFADAFTVIMTALNPFGLVIKALLPILPTLVDAFTTLGTALGGALLAILPTITSLIDTLVTALSGVLAGVLPIIIGLIIQLVDVFAGLLPVLLPVIDMLAGLLVGAIERLMPIIVLLAENIGTGLGLVLGIVGPLLATLIPILAQIFEAAAPVIDVVLTLVEAFLPLVAALLPLIGAILPPLAELLLALLVPILGLVTPLLNLLIPAIQFLADVLGFIIGIVVAVISTFVGLITGSEDTYKGIKKVWDGIMGFFAGIPKAIGDFFSGAGKWLVDAGKNIIDGLLNGLKSMGSTIGKFFLDLLPDWIVGPFKTALGIRSPSTKFFGYGRNIVQGAIGGVRSGFGAIQRTMGQFADVVTGGFTGSPSFAGSAGIGSAGTRTYHVEIHTLAPSAEVGRAVKQSLEDLERQNGRRSA